MKRDPLAGYDLGLLFAVLTLLAIGILMVYSASGVRALDALNNPQYYLLLQSAWGLLGLVGLALAARIDYHRYRAVALPLLVLVVALLVAVLLPGIGSRGGGAVRWLRLVGPVGVQPAEPAKLALVLYLAAWLSTRRAALTQGRLGLAFLLVVGAVAALVAVEPDLGTAVVLVATALTMYFLAGARLIEFAAIGVLASVTLASLALAAPYRVARLFSFLDPWSDAAGLGFHTIQAIYALALGGPFGEGLGAGREKFGFLPAPYTDSIYAVLADELGLVGALAVLLLFGVVMFQGMRIVRRAPDPFGALLAAGITASIGLQAWINMAVIVSLVPMTGITLPFISYGGSSLLVSLTGVGMLLNIGRQGALAHGRTRGSAHPPGGRRDRRSYEPVARGSGRDPRAAAGDPLRLRRGQTRSRE